MYQSQYETVSSKSITSNLLLVLISFFKAIMFDIIMFVGYMASLKLLIVQFCVSYYNVYVKCYVSYNSHECYSVML